MSKTSATQTRREAFDHMERALTLLDSIAERKTAALLDHAIAVMALREQMRETKV